MTRLRSIDIIDIAANLPEYDEELIVKTGCNLKDIACHAVDFGNEKIEELFDSVMVGIVPITAGKGLIDGFSETVKQIVTHLGFRAFVTQAKDAAGMAEAFEKKSDIIMLADDNRFVALNAKGRGVIDNAEATGRGYVAGLNLMTGGLQGKSVLVIGCGRVGRSAVSSLVTIGATVTIYDINHQSCHDLADDVKDSMSTEIRVEKELNNALISHRILIDASPGVNIIDEEHIISETYICAPGIPLGLRGAALKKVSGRLLHDPLQIGVATMVVDAASKGIDCYR